jgi:serine/threonine protein kinase
MGVVYEAVELGLDRVVGLKVIAPELAADAAFRERFVAESRVAASIDHPNVVPIFRAGEEEGRLFVAMRFVEGDDLGTLVRREGPMAPERAVRIVAQVAAALDAAHVRSLVHRDVKPANVLITADDHVYLTDFGLAKNVTMAAGRTRAGIVVGTPDYLAPEQIRAMRSVRGRTSMRSGACCSSCSQGGWCSRTTRSRRRCGRISPSGRRRHRRCATMFRARSTKSCASRLPSAARAIRVRVGTRGCGARSGRAEGIAERAGAAGRAHG